MFAPALPSDRRDLAELFDDKQQEALDVLGSGFHWYPESPEKFHMALAGLRRVPNDVVLLTYVPTAAPS
jgi:hypothetical protein